MADNNKKTRRVNPGKTRGSYKSKNANIPPNYEYHPLSPPRIIPEVANSVGQSIMYDDNQNYPQEGFITKSQEINYYDMTPKKNCQVIDNFQQHHDRSGCGKHCIDDKFICPKSHCPVDLIKLHHYTQGTLYDEFHDMKVPAEYKLKGREYYKKQRREALDTTVLTNRIILDQKCHHQREVQQLRDQMQLMNNNFQSFDNAASIAFKEINVYLNDIQNYLFNNFKPNDIEGHIENVSKQIDCLNANLKTESLDEQRKNFNAPTSNQQIFKPTQKKDEMIEEKPTLKKADRVTHYTENTMRDDKYTANDRFVEAVWEEGPNGEKIDI